MDQESTASRRSESPRAKPSWAGHAEIGQDLFCQECGYNLRGLASDRCPECGHRLDLVRSDVSQIPWNYRRERGLLRAYWQTVWMVMFRHKRFCAELARPVGHHDAQAFRWMTVLHAHIPMLLATVLAYPRFWPAPFNEPVLDEAFTAIWPAAVLHGCWLLFLVAATGAPSYLFHPRELPLHQQDRAIAMSYYAASALAWSPLSLLAGVAGFAIAPRNRVIGEALVALAVLLPPAQVFAWWADLIHVAIRVMPQRRGYALRVACVVPLLWTAAALLTCGLIPLTVLFVLLVLTSLG